MMEIEKRPYELSLWEDVIAVGENGDISTDEKRLAIIGSNTSKSPIGAFNIELERKINGEKTLTFSICANYYDQDSKQNLPNPYVSKLTNESKVKLKWEDKWYDFVVKNVVEDSKQKVYTYTAKDQHVQELAKAGYNIQFDKELENDTKTAEEFVEEILNGTDWTVDWKDDETDLFREYTTEPVYECEINSSYGITLTPLFPNENYDEITLEGGTHARVFIPYSIIQNHTARCQVLYGGDETEEPVVVDDEGTLDSTKYKNYYIDVEYNGDIPAGFTAPTLRDDCRGRHYVRRALSKYDSKIDKYVNIYKKEGVETEYYGFVDTDYKGLEVVRNLITNSKDFVNSTGWKNTGNGVVTVDMYPSIDTNLREDYSSANIESLLVIPQGQIFNSGMSDNRYDFGTIEKEAELCLDIEYTSDETVIGYITEIKICDYEITEGVYKPKTSGNIYATFADTKGINSAELIWSGRSFNKEEMKNSKIGIFFTTNGITKIKSIALYRKKLNDKGNIIKPDSFLAESKELIIQNYCYYNPTQKEGNYSVDTITYEYTGTTPSADFVLQYDENYSKKRSMTASKSNRFNLLQNVCETFECWLDIQVDHDESGKITSKKIGLKNFVKKRNFAGFKYGINLDKIKRTIDSNQIVTKLIVEPNANEFATNGFCSIARAPLNPTGTNVIYNFDYYIKRELLSGTMVQSALNAYNKKIKGITNEINVLQEQKINKEKVLIEAEAQAFFEKEQLEAAQKGLYEAWEDLKEFSKKDYEWFVEKSNSEPNNKEYLDLMKTTQCRNYLTEIVRYKQIIDEYQSNDAIIAGAEVVAILTKDAIEELNQQIEIKTVELLTAERDFHNKFARFIQEGTWISEKYIDDDLYYLDSLSTLYTSSRPKVTYNIDVFDLSGIEGYENYHFEIGDETFVQDPEFFGWTTIDGVRTPYKEKVVISESKTGIDNITKNTIKVQNYKTQFEDLFQRIAAATETLQYNSGRYEKFSNAIESDGTISHTALQGAVDKNGLIISGAGHQTVTCDDKGITTIDNNTPSSQVRIIGGGVFLTDDGGATWSTGITGDGINADVINSGIVNTGKVNIMNGEVKTHVWDDKGISSYRTDHSKDSGVVTGVDPSTFVRQDEFGIYGIKNNAEFNARVITNGESGVEKIKRDARYALTWDGFMLKTGEGNERVEIDSEKDFVVYDADNHDRIKIGRLGGSYGMKIINNGGVVTIGSQADNVVIDAGSDDKNFQVLADGTMKATGAIIDGTIYATDGEFSGTVTAAQGEIGDFSITDGGLSLPGGEFQSLQDPETKYYHISSITSDSNNNGTLDFTVTNWDDKKETPKYHYTVTDSSKGLKISSNAQVDSVYLVKSLPTGNGECEYFYRTKGLNTERGGTAQIPAAQFADASESNPVYVIAVRNALAFNTETTNSLTITRDGQITASGGAIGGWNITENGLSASYNNYHIKLFQSYPGTTYNWRILVGKGNADSKIGFRVDRDGNLGLASAPAVDSDMNLKNSIEEIPNSYSKMFDNLHPVRFKYNDGTSDRYHTGLIAQELQEAIIEADLTEKDVAAICTWQDGHSSVRYEELIALCIKEIQDLKKEVSTLKNQIEQLQS